jgi:hypothetical protein
MVCIAPLASTVTIEACDAIEAGAADWALAVGLLLFAATAFAIDAPASLDWPFAWPALLQAVTAVIDPANSSMLPILNVMGPSSGAPEGRTI